LINTFIKREKKEVVDCLRNTTSYKRWRETDEEKNICEEKTKTMIKDCD
jgi:predicted acetyltransferase